MGHGCFAVVLHADAEPARYEALDSWSGMIDEAVLVPAATPGLDLRDRIDIRVVNRADPERGTVVLEGRSDDVTWSFAAALRPDGLWTSHEAWHPGGGGGSGSGGGGIPSFDADHVLDLTGWGGTDGRSWWFEGVADPSVEAVRLRLDSGAEVTVPTAGRGLGWEFVVVAASLPIDALAVLADALDADGEVLQRLYLTGRSSWLRQALAEQRGMRSAAEAPAPDEVGRFIDAVIGHRLPEAGRGEHREGHRVHAQVVTEAELIQRWPVRPLFLPPAGVDGTWVLASTHDRWELGQVAAVGLMWVSSGVELGEPDPDQVFELCDGGALVMRQVLSWSSQDVWLDPPNTVVRGRPGVLMEMTAEVNNADHLDLTWVEDVTAPEGAPMDELRISVLAHPHRHPLDEVRRFAEALRELG